MNILITGGAGFVGRHFTEYFLKRGDDVWVVDPLIRYTGAKVPSRWYFDPRQYKTFHFYETDCRIFFHSPQPKFDLVLHLAAVVGGRLMIENKPLSVADDLSIDSEFWQWAVEHTPGKVITFSSSAAYPIFYQTEDNYQLLKEDMIRFDMDIGMPDMTYGWAKLTTEYLGRMAYEKHGIKSVVFRPFSGYGEDQDDSYPFPNLLLKLKKTKGYLPVWGTGKQKRDFIHIEDCVRGVITTMNLINNGEAINLSTGIYTDFITLIKKARKFVPKESKLIIAPQSDKPVGVFARAGDTTKQKKFGFTPKISIEEGIRRFYEYHRNHKH